MAIVGISLKETEEYISSLDTAKTESDGAVIWILGSLDADTRAALADERTEFSIDTEGDVISSKRSMALKNNQIALKAVRAGLRGWRNFKDVNGNAIPFDGVETLTSNGPVKYISTKTLNRIPLPVIVDLGNRIIELNSVSASLEGESQAQ